MNTSGAVLDEWITVLTAILAVIGGSALAAGLTVLILQVVIYVLSGSLTILLMARYVISRVERQAA